VASSPERAKYRSRTRRTIVEMVALVLWLLLLAVAWPLAALVLYPLVWLLLLPFRIVGVAVDGVLGLLRAVLYLPARVLAGPRAARG
jgi:hypothetical protein